MQYRGPGEEDRDLHVYALVHKPWTGIAGVRRRSPEPPLPGTYGGMFRELTGLAVPASVTNAPCGDETR